jgi:hypothetical protein
LAIEDFKFQRDVAIRRAHKSRGRTLEVTMPIDEIDRQARARAMTVDQFIENYMARCEWGDGKSIRYTFVQKTDGKKQL